MTEIIIASRKLVLKGYLLYVTSLSIVPNVSVEKWPNCHTNKTDYGGVLLLIKVRGTKATCIGRKDKCLKLSKLLNPIYDNSQ